MITLAEMEVQYKDILEGIFALLAEDWKVCSVAVCLASVQADEDVPSFRVVELSPRLNEERVLLYDEKKPWMLLKLLDDDYLWSEMTEISYQVDGKRELT